MISEGGGFFVAHVKADWGVKQTQACFPRLQYLHRVVNFVPYLFRLLRDLALSLLPRPRYRRDTDVNTLQEVRVFLRWDVPLRRQGYRLVGTGDTWGYNTNAGQLAWRLSST